MKTIKKFFSFSNIAIILFVLFFSGVLGSYLNIANVKYFISNPAREYQTLGITEYFYNSEVELFYPRTELSFENEYLAIEFPLYQALCSLIAKFFSLNESLIKFISVFFFLSSSVLIYLFCKRFKTSKIFSLLSCSIYLVFPFNFLYQPSGLIDPFALFLSLLTFYLGICWVDSKFSYPEYVLFSLIGVIGVLTKFTPLILLIPTLLIYIIYQKRESGDFVRYIKYFSLTVFVWLVLLVFWYVWGDYLNDQTTLAGYTWGNVQNNFFSSNLAEFFSLIKQNLLNLFFMFINHKINDSLSFLRLVIISIAFCIGSIEIIKKNKQLSIICFGWILSFIFEAILISKAFLTHPYYWLPLCFAVIFPMAAFFEIAINFCSESLLEIKNRYNFSGKFESFSIILIVIVLLLIVNSIFPNIKNYQDMGLYKIDRNFLLISFITCVLILCALFIVVKLRIEVFRNVFFGLVLVILVLSIPENSFRYFQKYWVLPHDRWSINREFLENADFIAKNLPEDQKAVIVTDEIYQPHLQYLSGINGFLVFNDLDPDHLKFYASVQNPIQGCFSQSEYPMILNEECINYFTHIGIYNYFFLSNKNIKDYQEAVLFSSAAKFDFEFVNKLRDNNSGTITNVIHFKIADE